MPIRDTSIDDHSPLAHDILSVLEDFIDEIGDRGCTAHFNKVVDGKYYLHGEHLTQQPERFLEEHLVFPIIRDAFGYEIQPQPKRYAPRWPRKGGVPDFCIRSIPVDVAKDNDLRFFGEVKSPKKIENARNDMTDYLQSDIDLHAIAILTDGFDWELWVRPRNQPLDEIDNPYSRASLRKPLKTVQRRNMEVESYRPYHARKMIDVDSFSGFCSEAVSGIIEQEFSMKSNRLFV